MSKNTGTSELINYFTLGVNGDVGIGGNLTLSTIVNATVDTDRFLVSDSGVIKYRTGAQLLSDIGAQGLLTNPVTGTGAAGQVTYWSSSSEITGTSNFLFNVSERNLTIDRSLSTLGNAITISKGSDANQAWLAFRQGGGGNGTWRLGYTGDPYDFTINVGTDSSIGAQTLRIFEDSQNVVIGTSTTDNGAKLQVSGSVNIVGNGSSLLFDSLGQSKSGGIYYTNDFELLINNSRGVGSAIYLGNVNMDFHTNVSGNPRLRITSGGNILVGTTTDNGARLQLGGFSGAVNQNNGIKLTNNVGTIVGLEIGGSNDSYIGTISASNFSIRTANTPIITVASSGNVGIGTVSPNSKFEIQGSTSSPQFRISRSEQTNQGLTIQAGGGVTLLDSYDGTDTVFGSYTFNSTKGTNTVTRMRIDGSGNVGIGTSSPVNKLSVLVDGGGADDGIRIGVGSQGDGIKIVQRYLSDRVVATLGQSKYGVVTDSGALRLYDVGGTETVRLSGKNGYSSFITSGNVLIGTTTDSGYKLFVNGMSYLDGYNYASSIQYTRAVSNTVNPAGGEGVLIFSGGQAAMRMNSSYTMNFDMYNSGNQFTALQIRQTGNTVQVNSPDNQLSLEIAYQGSGHGYLGATASYGRALLAYSQNGGYVYLSSSSTWVSASDRNRKKNFENYNKGLSEICNLKPTLFNLKTQSDDEPKIAGLIAQEVGEHIQEAFSDGEFIGIDYNVLTVTIINAIKELKQQLDTLRNENN